MRALLRWIVGAPESPAAWNAPRVDPVVQQGGRKEYLDRVAGLLSGVDRETLAACVRNLLAMVYDLPASQRHHHAQPFGLFDHSLEVAELALREAQVLHFATTTAVYPEEQEYRVARLRFVTWLFGLMHDLGKVAGIAIHTQERRLWNPFVEPLADFYARHGRAQCSLTWIAGRGLDSHAWHTAYLVGRVVPAAAARYLGPRLLAEVLEQKTEAAKTVQRLITEADRRSADRDRRAMQEESQDSRPDERLLVAVPDIVERIPAVLAEGIRTGKLKPGEDLLVGRRHVLLRFPSALQKLGLLLREALGRESSEARGFDGSERSARILTDRLHERRLLVIDPASQTWKFKATREHGPGTFEVFEAVLVPNGLLGGELGLPVFANRLDIRRAVDDRPVDLGDFTAPVVPMVVPESKPTPVPVAGARAFLSPEALVAHIRQGVLEGWIPANQWNGQVYVLDDTTYFVSPRGFQRLVERGLYSVDPKREIQAYLDALAAIPCVRKRQGKILRTIQLRPEARPMWAVAFDTKGLFGDAPTIARVGIWKETSIRELTEEEHRSFLEKKRLAGIAVSPAGERGHA